MGRDQASHARLAGGLAAARSRGREQIPHHHWNRKADQAPAAAFPLFQSESVGFRAHAIRDHRRQPVLTSNRGQTDSPLAVARLAVGPVSLVVPAVPLDREYIL